MKNRSGKQLTLQQMQDPHFFDKTFEARRTIKLKKRVLQLKDRFKKTNHILHIINGQQQKD